MSEEARQSILTDGGFLIDKAEPNKPMDASQISAIIGDHSRQMKTQIFTVGDVGVRRQWILLITSPPITNKHGGKHGVSLPE